MSRVYDYASQGTWSLSCCPRCAGDNQRSQADGNQTFWWWGNPTDSVCGLCRAECDADEQDAYDREAESRANQLAWEATLADEAAAFEAHWWNWAGKQGGAS
jgi:hypothetical protein